MKSPEPELLEVLIAAAESRSLNEAAGKLKISQPAVSVKLQALGRQAPLPVFSYEGKRKVLTHYGRELYKIAKANRIRIDEAYENLNRTYATAETLTLRVGGRREIFEAFYPKLRFPGTVELISMPSAEAVGKLLEHKVDVALAYGKLLPDSPEVVAKKVFTSVSNFVIHKKLLGRARLKDLIHDKGFLLNTPCVTYRGGGFSLRDWIRHLSVPFEQLKVRGVAEDWHTVQSLVDSGWGYSVVPGHIRSSSDQLASVPLPTSVLAPYVFYLLFHRELKRVPAFRAILSRYAASD